MDIDAYYWLIRDVMTKNEFLKKIEEYRKAFGGLLEDETIALIILDEYNRLPRSTTTIHNLVDGQVVTLEVEVIDIIGERLIERGGKRHKRMDVLIGDSTGKCYLALWNSDIEKIGRKLRRGDRIRIIEGYVKEFPSGIWITLKRWSAIVILS